MKKKENSKKIESSKIKIGEEKGIKIIRIRIKRKRIRNKKEKKKRKKYK